MAKKRAASRAVAPKTILAVAIGSSGNNQIITTDPPAGIVRPYILGLIERMKTLTVPNTSRKYAIGTDYTIDYRECAESELADPATFTVRQGLSTDYVIVGMSTTVVKKASDFTYNTGSVPIIGVVSDPSKSATLGANICGVSGQRIQLARRCFDNFQKSVVQADRGKIANVYLLLKNFQPARDAKDLIESSTHPGINTKIVTVTDPNPDKIYDQIEASCTDPNSGLVILPADWFFGAADKIIAAARDLNIPDFWPVTDWVRAKPSDSAFGGYGVPQQWCGKVMADKIASIWKNNGAIPTPPWTNATAGDAKWSVSKTVAQRLGIDLSSSGPTIVP